MTEKPPLTEQDLVDWFLELSNNRGRRVLDRQKKLQEEGKDKTSTILNNDQDK